MADAPSSGTTIVELEINPATYFQEGTGLSPEQVCEQYAEKLRKILGGDNVTIDITEHTVRAEFTGQAEYVPDYGPEGCEDCDTLVITIGGEVLKILCYSYGLGSVRINGEEKKVA